jgi:hypothetical protein
MAEALRNDYAEIENTVRFDMHEEIIEHNGQQILEPGILVTDPSIFDIFSYKLTEGDVHSVLNNLTQLYLLNQPRRNILVTKIQLDRRCLFI